MRLRQSLIILFVCLFLKISGQITYSSVPKNKQLVGRNITTNKGELMVGGSLDDTTYDSLIVKTYRNGVLFLSDSIELDYTSGVALFSVSHHIEAELVNYSMEIWIKDGVIWALDRTISDLVAGDVYIIQGQSNAEAMQYSGSSAANASNFIRVYASGTESGSVLQSQDSWNIGQGDSNAETIGNTGQWGLKLAKLIVDNISVPVAIFNGARTARAIVYFERTSNYKSSPFNSNYGRLYYRLDQTNLTDFVRGIFWSQGEADAIFSTSQSVYESKFAGLNSDWREDYPNLEKVMVFQTRFSCGSSLNGAMKIKEAQRNVAEGDQNVTILPSTAFSQHTDDCHFQFQNGYEAFADRAFEFIARELYSIYPDQISSPKPASIKYLDDSQSIEIASNIDEILTVNSINYSDFIISNDASQSIETVSATDNKLSIKLSQRLSPCSDISFVGDLLAAGNLVTNQYDIELISFYQAEIIYFHEREILKGDTFVFGDQSLTTSGTFTETFSTTLGCDSIVELSLTVTDVPTPVSLIDFTGKSEDDGVLLEWSTANEVSNDYFDLSRSFDGKHYESFVQIGGFGDSNEIKNYRYFDRGIVAPFVFYLLRQVDFDGTTEDLKTIRVTKDKIATEIDIYPTISKGRIINIVTNVASDIQEIKIVSMTGRWYKALTSLSLNQLSVDFHSFPSGTYILYMVFENDLTLERKIILN